jgi:CheY-like chemotaxis protein
LLNNAAKYTPEGGNIVVSTEVREGEVLLSVVDNGIGIDPELSARVFELFAQAKRSPDRSSGGLGLGLALVKSLVELHGGTVMCVSEGGGKGSRFTVCLPLASATRQDAAEDPSGDHMTGPDKALRILVVDDNVDAAQMLAMFLKVSGYHVDVELDPLRALERSRISPPDVFLLDIGLPEMDGNELARRLRAQPETENALLVAVTGYGYAHDREKSLASGFDHHFVKPVDPSKLLSLLSEESK